MQTLSGCNIMIVEDDYFVARELAEHFRSADATVLGPFPSVSDACHHVDKADLAMLDVTLRGQLVYRLADMLMDIATPFVFYSAQDPATFPQRFAHIARLSKLCGTKSVAHLLRSQLHTATVLAVLPKLRLPARMIVRDTAAADRLVEATLRRTLYQRAGLIRILPLQDWLLRLMQQVLAERGHELMS